MGTGSKKGGIKNFRQLQFSGARPLLPAIDGFSCAAAVIGSPQIAAAARRPAHATAGADLLAGAIPAPGQGIGPVAADLQQGRPERRAFGKNIGQTLVEHSGNGECLCMAEQTRIEPASRREIRILDKGAGLRPRRALRDPIQSDHLADFFVQFAEAGLGSVAIEQPEVLGRGGRRNH